MSASLHLPAPSLEDRQSGLRPSSDASDKRRCAWQNNSDLRELAGKGIDLNRPGMLLHNDVVSDGQAKAGPYELGCGDLAAMAKPGTVVKF